MTTHVQRVELHAAAVGLTARRVVAQALVVGLVLILGLALVGGLLKAAQGNLVHVPDATFYMLLTLHGAGMIATVLLLTAVAFWYLLRDLLQLRVEALWGALLAMVVGLLLAAVSVVYGGFAAAWTFLYPLPFVGTTWPPWATGFFFFGLLWIGIGFAVYCLDILAGVIRQYGSVLRGLALDTLFPALAPPGAQPAPPPVIAATMVALDGLVTVAAGSVLFLDLVARSLNPHFPVDPLWIKNLTYFFGHTLANLTIYVSAGVIYAVLPAYAERPWRTNRIYALSWCTSLLFVPWAWPHHLYMDFVQAPWLQLFGEASTYIATIPAAVVTIFGALLLIYRAPFRWRVGSTFFAAGLLGWLVGGIAALLDATIPFNEVLHNTLWVPAHFHTYLLGGVFLFVLGFASYFAGEDGEPSPWAKWFLRLFFVGLTGFLLMFYAGGAEGVPRREAVEPAPGPLLAAVATGFVVLLLAGLVALLVEMWLRGRRNALGKVDEA